MATNMVGHKLTATLHTCWCAFCNQSF